MKDIGISLLFREHIVAGVLVLAALLLSGCDGKKYEHYQITIEVVDNGKVITGSSVQQIGCRSADPKWSVMDTGGCAVYGEAAFLRLSSERYLVMPFKGGRSRDWSGYGEALINGGSGTTKLGWDADKENLPMLVTFDDPQNPRSVQLVDPTNMGKSLGAGISLVAVHVRRTDLPVTDGAIMTAFPWLRDMSEQTYFSGQAYSSDNRLYSQIQKLHFVNGERK